MNKNIEVALIGDGLMGHGLALVHAMGGHKVKMQDISKEQLEAGAVLVIELDVPGLAERRVDL